MVPSGVHSLININICNKRSLVGRLMILLYDIHEVQIWRSKNKHPRWLIWKVNKAALNLVPTSVQKSTQYQKFFSECPIFTVFKNVILDWCAIILNTIPFVNHIVSHLRYIKINTNGRFYVKIKKRLYMCIHELYRWDSSFEVVHIQN